MDVLDPQQKLRLLRAVRNGTVHGSAKWQQILPDNQYSFSTSVKGFKVGVRAADEDDRHPFLLVVFQGDNDVPVTSVSSSENPDYAELLEVIYNAAKRQTLKYDELASELLAAVETLEEPF